MHRGMMAIDRAATAANNAQSRGPAAAGQRARAPHPDDLDWHAARSSVPNPLDGHAGRERRGGLARLALRQRHREAERAARPRVGRAQHHAPAAGGARRQLRRRLHANAAHADALYEALERSHADAPPERQRARAAREPRAQLGARASRIRTPRTRARARARARPISAHPRPVQELVDWDRVFDEGSRLYGIVRARHKLRETGTPHAEIVKRQPTGYHYLDDAHHSSPSIAGDAVRRVLYRKETGADPPWHEPTVLHRVHRRMSERPDGGEGRGSHLRRLGVAFFEATIAAPFSFVDLLMPSGVTVKASEITFWEATLRYLVSSTVGCYFVAPVRDEVGHAGRRRHAGRRPHVRDAPERGEAVLPGGMLVRAFRAPAACASHACLLVCLRSSRLRCRNSPRSATSRARRASTSTSSTTTTTATAAGRPRR